jgi:choline dehydrogenase-like flavoprotein
LIVDLEKGGSVDQSDFEVCILGAGAAGITLATSLAQRGVRTLLLEAGGRRYNSRDQDLYWGEVGEGLAYNGLYDGRFRILGGSTTQWAGQILEFDDFVFEKRPWVPGSGWPFHKSELAPYYKRATELEGLAGGPKDAEEVWHLLGLQPPVFGADLVSEFSSFTPKTNFAELHRDAIENDPNLTVCLHANACEFILGDDDTTVVGVRCKTFGGHETHFHARAFVLCVGGIEACRFLLQPQKDGTVAPWNRRDMVGRHFQDHLLCYVADIVEQNSMLPDIYLDFVSVHGYRFQQKMKLPAETQQRLGTLDIGGFITYFTGGHDDMAKAYETVRWIRTRRYEKLKPIRLAHLAANFHKLLWHRFPYSRSIRPIGRSSRRSLKLNVNCEQDPLSEGRISLSPMRDALGTLRVKVDWRASERELHSIRKYVEVVREMFQRNDLGRVVPIPSLYTDGEFASTFRDSFHHIGGTRMATSEELGVVDPNLRLYGTKNAYVCSTSVYPSAGFANPTHTLIALALRLADHLQRRIVSGATEIGQTRYVWRPLS